MNKRRRFSVLVAALLLGVLAGVLRVNSKRLDAGKQYADGIGGQTAAGGAGEQSTPMPEGSSVTEPEAPYSVFDGDGVVDRSVLKDLGISYGDSGKVAKVLQDVRSQMSSELMKRAVPAAAGDGEPNARSLYIPGDKARGQSILTNLKSEVATIVGDEAATKVMAGLQPTGQLGYFGIHDVYITVRTSDGGMVEAFFDCFDPRTGQKVRYGEVSDQKQFQAIFGDSFNLSDLAKGAE